MSGNEGERVLDERIETAYAEFAANPRKRRAWEATNPGNHEMHRELADALRSIGGEQLRAGDVLDVGCGNGGWLQELSEDVPVDRLYGVDAIADRVRNATNAVPGAHIEHADARTLPFEDGRFSFVLLVLVLMNLDRHDTAVVLGECDRVLGRGGVLAIYEARVNNPFNRLTRPIRRRDITLPAESRTMTFLPPITRRLGRLAPTLYPVLARIGPLRTHRLWTYCKPA